MPSIFIDVEEGENCPYSLQLVFSPLDEGRPVLQARLYDESPDGILYDVVAWDNEQGESEATALPVEDSGQARAFLVYGGNGGIRLRPASSHEPWDLAAADQLGRSHLLLSDANDIVWADS